MSSNGNNGNNGHGKNRAGYEAAAGIVTADDDADDNNSTSVSETTKAAAASAAATQTAPPNVGEALNLKTVERKTRSRRMLMAVALVAGMIILCVVGFLFFSSDGSGKRTVKTNVRNQAGGGKNETISDERLTADAIAQARSQVAPSPQNPAPLNPNGATPAIIVQQSDPIVPTKVGTTTLNPAVDPKATDPNTPVVRPADGVAGTVNTTNQPSSGAATQPSSVSRSANDASGRSRGNGTRQSSKPNDQKSLIYGEVNTRSDSSQNSGSDGDERARSINAGFALGTTGRRGESQNIVTRPSFGSLLPVRTLGAIYTLRSGALVRMELTRDVSGAGWKLPRRTVIVGTLRAGEYDRAYISVVGYIDGSSGRLVSFGGSLLGSDAGEGIKGERRQVTGRWSRIFGTIANKGFDLAKAALGGRNGATVVLGDAARPEINALSGNGDRREFIAVKAGSMGYVSVTDLPREIEGVDTLTQMNPDALAQLLNSGSNTGTGLGDEEVAQLLSSGSTAQIRAAMPRMNDNMRRIAAQVINQSEK